MNQFIAALLGDLSLVGDAWEDIYNEYISLRESKNSLYILDMMKEITYLQTKVYIINKCVEFLAVDYNMEIVQELKLVGCKGKFNYEDKFSYSSDLKMASSFAKKYKLQFQSKEKELELYMLRHGGKVVERREFDIWAITLGQFMGYRVDYDVITVTEYCNMMNLYDKYCEIKNAENNNLIPEGARK